MRRMLVVLTAMLAVAPAAGCGGGNGGDPGRGSGLPGGNPATAGPAPAKPTPGSTTTTGLHNDAFPCNLATQAEIAAMIGGSVSFDEIEPGGQTCVYALTDAASADVDISVFTDEDKSRWTQYNQIFPAWSSGADLGGKAITGLGDAAFLSETPGYAGQLDVWIGAKLLRITVNVPRRLADSDVDKLVSLGRVVAGRV